MRKLAISILVVFLGISTSLIAQDDNTKHGIGFATGFGNQGILEVQYSYDVVFFSASI